MKDLIILCEILAFIFDQVFKPNMFALELLQVIFL